MYIYLFFGSTFFSSDANRRSTFITSSPEGSCSEDYSKTEEHIANSFVVVYVFSFDGGHSVEILLLEIYAGHFFICFGCSIIHYL